ncbi:unnamed protein product, partial [Rotaria magnacalcarata]
MKEKQLKIDQRRTTNVLTDMVRTIVNVLAEHKPYLRKALIGSDVPVEAWWSLNL